jgi:hypothetical protein
MAGNYNGSLDSAPLPGVSTGDIGADLGGMYALPPGAQVFYVRGNGTTVTSYSNEQAGFVEKLSPSVAKALSYCVSGRGDRVVVLPGHTENIAAADAWSSLVAGTKIIGLGAGTSRPTFTWTAAASTVLFDVANVSISNCILNMDPGTGTVSVATPITVSAAGCSIKDCQIRVSTDANSKAGTTTGCVSLVAGATDFEFSRNEVFGATAGECVTVLSCTAAIRLKATANKITVATTAAAVGPLNFVTTASTDIYVADNILINNKANSTNCLTMHTNLVHTGWLVRNLCRVGTGTAGLLLDGVGVDVSLQDNYVINGSILRGLVIGTASS